MECVFVPVKTVSCKPVAVDHDCTECSTQNYIVVKLISNYINFKSLPIICTLLGHAVLTTSHYAQDKHLPHYQIWPPASHSEIFMSHCKSQN